jgi:hypothetical protein
VQIGAPRSFCQHDTVDAPVVYGEPLFKVEYEDPDFDNYYFDESDGDEDDV